MVCYLITTFIMIFRFNNHYFQANPTRRTQVGTSRPSHHPIRVMHLRIPMRTGAPDTLAPSPLPSYPSATNASDPFVPITTPPAAPSKRLRSAKTPSRRRDPSHIRRPRNSFFVLPLRVHRRGRRRWGNGLQVELSKQAACVWNAMPDDEKRDVPGGRMEGADHAQDPVP